MRDTESEVEETDGQRQKVRQEDTQLENIPKKGEHGVYSSNQLLSFVGVFE